VKWRGEGGGMKKDTKETIALYISLFAYGIGLPVLAVLAWVIWGYR